jgi:hypothetical protein
MASFAVLPFLVLGLRVAIVVGGYQPNTYGGYGGYVEVKPNPYLPAPPGETPPCAKHGATYCEKIETYPMEVISYLLYKWGRTYEQFIKSEADQEFVVTPKHEYGPGQPLPYDSYYPKDTGYFNTSGKQFVDSYFRKQQSGAYDYSYSIPQSSNIHQAALAVPPILHSVWWNHRDTSKGTQAFPHLMQYNQESWRQRVRRRVRRQADGNSLCPTTSSYVSAQAAMNNAGNWMYVVNMDNMPQFRQFVKSERCANGDGSPCNNVCSVAPGRSATCRQKFVQKRLVALDGSGSSLRNDVFWFPHCCSCEVV